MSQLFNRSFFSCILASFLHLRLDRTIRACVHAMNRASSLATSRVSPRSGLLGRIAAAKAAKEEICSSPKADLSTPTKAKIEPSLKRKASSVKLGGDSSTPQKRAPGQSSGKSDRDDDEDVTLDCLFDEDGDCELLEEEKKVCWPVFE